jgi:hypothetical protein
MGGRPKTGAWPLRRIALALMILGSLAVAGRVGASTDVAGSSHFVPSETEALLEIVDGSYSPGTLTVGSSTAISVSGRVVARHRSGPRQPRSQLRRCVRNLPIEVAISTQTSFSGAYGVRLIARTDERGRFSVTYPAYSPPNWDWSMDTSLRAEFRPLTGPRHHRGDVFCGTGPGFYAKLPHVGG